MVEDSGRLVRPPWSGDSSRAPGVGATAVRKGGVENEMRLRAEKVNILEMPVLPGPEMRSGASSSVRATFLSDLVTRTGIARRCGVQRVEVDAWVERNDFPSTRFRLGRWQVWDLAAIRRWRGRED